MLRCGPRLTPFLSLHAFPPSQVPRLRPTAYATIARHDRTVSRAYGGSLCATCTRSRILRAFIVEEQKIVKKVLMEKLKSGATKA